MTQTTIKPNRGFSQHHFSFSKRKSGAGFTLIELLVVIAIIGILASVVLASLNTAREKARDAQRLSDMHQIRTALELFYLEYGRYPGPTDGVVTQGSFIGTGEPIDAALGKFMGGVPKDPLHDGTVYFYSYDPLHYIDLLCNDSGPSGVVFGFNHAESATNLRKETCSGTNMNLDDADYNQALLKRGE